MEEDDVNMVLEDVNGKLFRLGFAATASTMAAGDRAPPPPPGEVVVRGGGGKYPPPAPVAPAIRGDTEDETP